jgi:hypothetical protein
MAHCGDEPAAVLAMMGSQGKSLPALAGAWDGAAIKEANDGVPSGCDAVSACGCRACGGQPGSS